MLKNGLLYKSLIAVFLCFVFLSPRAQGAPTVAPNAPVMGNDYTLTLFLQDVVMKNPNASVSGFLDVKQGMTLLGPPVLDLWYSCSPTVRPDLSSISIAVNGVPVVSRTLIPDGAFKSNWQVPLPLNQMRQGPNEVTISVLHRSIDGLCRDIDNEGNWFIIRPETTVKFRTGIKAYTLRDYPFPFVNEYMASKMNTAIFLSEVTESSIAAMLQMAAGLGNGAPAGAPMRLTIEPGRPGPLAAANEICVGLADAWFGGAVGNFPADSGVLRLQSLNAGYQRLYVCGTSDKGISLASEALTRSSFMQTLPGSETVVTAPFGEDTLRLKKEKKGRYALTDLGFDGDVEVAGAFHQEADFYLARPANYDIGEDSYVELHFRHSKILDPKKSAVTIYINDKPVRSAVLMAENAESGILKAPIPETELYQPGWRIRFAFYHDLGIIDCSKRYDDVAWSVIEKETSVYLAPGDRQRILNLSDFPYRFNRGKNDSIPLTMWLSPNPSSEELTLALKLAYWIGRTNAEKIKWQVALSPDFSVEKAPGSVIVVGASAALYERSGLKNLLPVFPKENGEYLTAPWFEAAQDALHVQNLYQVAESKNGNFIYAFGYADTVSMNRYLDFLIAGGGGMNGQAALGDAEGKLISYTMPNAKASSSESIFQNLFSNTVAFYVMILLVVVLGTVGLMVYLKKRRS